MAKRFMTIEKRDRRYRITRIEVVLPSSKIVPIKNIYNRHKNDYIMSVASGIYDYFEDDHNKEPFELTFAKDLTKLTMYTVIDVDVDKLKKHITTYYPINDLHIAEEPNGLEDEDDKEL